MKLSAHFTLEEFLVTQHRNIDNTPSWAAIPNLRTLALGLELVRKTLGNAPILISSGYRSPELNAAVGGQKNSQHTIGKAADFIAPAFGTPVDIMVALRKSAIDYDQLILEFNRWVHISFTQNPRRMELVIDSQGTRPFA